MRKGRTNRGFGTSYRLAPREAARKRQTATAIVLSSSMCACSYLQTSNSSVKAIPLSPLPHINVEDSTTAEPLRIPYHRQHEVRLHSPPIPLRHLLNLDHHPLLRVFLANYARQTRLPRPRQEPPTLLHRPKTLYPKHNQCRPVTQSASPGEHTQHHRQRNIQQKRRSWRNTLLASQIWTHYSDKARSRHVRPDWECGFDLPLEEGGNGSDEIGRDPEASAQRDVQRYRGCEERGWGSRYLHDERGYVFLKKKQIIAGIDG
jgi:hypothetical protein